MIAEVLNLENAGKAQVSVSITIKQMDHMFSVNAGHNFHLICVPHPSHGRVGTKNGLRPQNLNRSPKSTRCLQLGHRLIRIRVITLKSSATIMTMLYQIITSHS